MSSTEHGKGKIQHNHLRALVRSRLFPARVEKDKTKYRRKPKHKNDPKKDY